MNFYYFELNQSRFQKNITQLLKRKRTSKEDIIFDDMMTPRFLANKEVYCYTYNLPKIAYLRLPRIQTSKIQDLIVLINFNFYRYL